MSRVVGARLVKATFDQWKNLPDAPFRLLVCMALTAKDTDVLPKFWAGRSAQARGMGWDIPGKDIPDKERERAEKVLWRRLARVVQQLTDAGAITVDRAGAPGRAARYRLNLDDGCHVATPDDSANGCHHATPDAVEQVSRGDPNRCRVVTPTDVTTRHPEEEKEEIKDDGSAGGQLTAVVSASSRPADPATRKKYAQAARASIGRSTSHDDSEGPHDA